MEIWRQQKVWPGVLNSRIPIFYGHLWRTRGRRSKISPNQFKPSSFVRRSCVSLTLASHNQMRPNLACSFNAKCVVSILFFFRLFDIINREWLTGLAAVFRPRGGEFQRRRSQVRAPVFKFHTVVSRVSLMLLWAEMGKWPGIKYGYCG